MHRVRRGTFISFLPLSPTSRLLFLFRPTQRVGERCAQSGTAQRKGKSGQPRPQSRNSIRRKHVCRERKGKQRQKARTYNALTTYLHCTFKSAEARIVCDFRQVTVCNSWDIRKFAPNIEIQKVYDDSKRNTRSLQTLL